MLNEDGYPDEASLKEIKEWNITKEGVQGLLDLVEENTHFGDWSFCIKGKHVLWLEYHTGGWSGNEDVIDALRSNLLFFPLYWKKTEVGGHYYFKIKPIVKETK